MGWGSRAAALAGLRASGSPVLVVAAVALGAIVCASGCSGTLAARTSTAQPSAASPPATGLPAASPSATPALSFAPEMDVPTSPGPAAIAVGDFDRDGVPDLAVADSRTATVTIRLGRGDGTFGRPRSFPVAAGSLSLAVADLDRDGRPDLVTTSAAGYGKPVAVGVLLGEGDGSFARQRLYRYATDTGAYSYAPLAIADLDGDGRPDVVTSWGLDVFVLPGGGDGTLGRPLAFPADVQDVGSDGAVAALAAGDLTGAGRGDVVAGGREGVNQPDGIVSVLLGDGDGGFRAATTAHERESLPVGLALADLDRDGRQDLVTAYQLDNEDWGLGDDFSAVTVSLGRGGGRFAPARVYDLTAERSLGGPVVADFNGDGDLDVALAGGRGVLVMPGDGAGGLGTGTAYGRERWAYGEMVTAGDFDRDGRPDLAAASRDDDCTSVAVFLDRSGDPGAP